MRQKTDKIRTGPVKMLVLVAGFVLLLVYGTLSVTAQDPFWFLKGFDYQPARIVVYHHQGQRTELRPGDPGFAELASAVQTCLDQGVDRPSGMGFSDASLLDAYTRYVSVEAFFDQPVKLHAWFHTGEPTQMLFPITGRHSELTIALLGQNGHYLSSPPVLRTIEPIREALKTLGYDDD
jgi:hypothetical protein